MSSSWTRELHRLGYLAGHVRPPQLGAKHLSDSYSSTSYARPGRHLDRPLGQQHRAHRAGRGSPAPRWANHQRGKQYRGDHDETYGGVTINIDSDRFDAPVATVAYTYTATGAIR